MTNIFRLTDETMALVAAEARSGKGLLEIAAQLQISQEMAASALRKWPLIERMRATHAL